MSRRLEGTFVVATHNKGKLREIEELVAPFGLNAVSAASLGLPEPEEDGTTFIAFNTAALNGLIPSSSNLTIRSPTF